MRISAVLILIVSLAACNRAKNDQDAVRQGVVDYLKSKGFDVPKAMTVTLNKVETKGSEADATVSITPAGGDARNGMTMRYHLEQKGDKWAVVGRAESGASPHGGAGMPTAPAAADPHSGATGSPKMPSPEDLPPAKK